MPLVESPLPNFSDLPKADCHLHLTGALGPEDIRELAPLADVDLRSDEPLEDLMRFENQRIWPLTKEITSSPVALSRALGILAARSAEDNVGHLEVTINPSSMRSRYGLTVPDFAAAVADAVAFARDESGVELKIKCGVNRREGPESVGSVEEFFLGMPEEHRAFIDLNGEEATYATAGFVTAFQGLVQREVPVVIHAGEFGEPHATQASLESALDIRPQRIAHALAAIARPDLMQRILDQDIVVEVAPTSNMLTGVIPEISQHPLVHYYRQGMKIVLGTDDPALFGKNTITTELEVVNKAGLSPEEVVELNRLSLTYATTGY